MTQANQWDNKKYYVNNSEVLALIDIWKDGNRRQQRNVEDLLIKRLSYLVCARIRGYRDKSFYNDLLQEGKLGLIKALNKFDSTRSPNFFKFAIWHIQDSVSNYLNWYKKIYREIPEQEFFAPCPESASPYEQYEQLQKNEILLEAIERLPEMDRFVLINRFGFNGSGPRTFQQIGDVFSLSRQRIEQIQSRALERLKKDRKIKEFRDM